MRPSQDNDARTVRFQEASCVVASRRRALGSIHPAGSLTQPTSTFLALPQIQGKVFLGGLDSGVSTNDIKEYCGQW